MSFICEVDVYNLLACHHIKTPKHLFIPKNQDNCRDYFHEGEEVVFKLIAKDLWHKSDIGGVLFEKYNQKSALRIHQSFDELTHENFIGTLICEKASIASRSGLPHEALVSLRRDISAGTVVTIGIGGLYAERLAKAAPSSLLLFPIHFYSADEAFKEFSKSLLGEVWLGTLRQGRPLTDSKRVAHFFDSLWSLAKEFEANNDYELIEINPFVVDQKGEIVALDGVGQKSVPITLTKRTPSSQSLLAPKSIAIMGASTKMDSVGSMILKNIKECQLPSGSIRVIRPGGGLIQDIECEDGVAALKKRPVDILILSLAAKLTIETIEAILVQGGGAAIIYLVAGGIGDGADKEGYGKKLKHLLNEKRLRGEWTPSIIGPNGLGMINSTTSLNSLFIPKEKLPLKFDEESEIAMISQSGAFLITRISNDSDLSFKYAFSIGNQIDLSLSDLVEAVSTDKKIKLISLYVEGFAELDALKLGEQIQRLSKENRSVLLLKGGQSERGQSAAAGHTGAMASSFLLTKRVLEKAGAYLASDISSYRAALIWLKSFPKRVSEESYCAILTNAGYESVASADQVVTPSGRDILLPMNANIEARLNQVIEQNNLTGLVAATSPLDLTPMADEKAYLESVEAFSFESNVEFIVVGLVPLTKRLETFKLESAKLFAESIKKIAVTKNKRIGVVVDSGEIYAPYKKLFRDETIPVFDSIDQAMNGIMLFYR